MARPKLKVPGLLTGMKLTMGIFLKTMFPKSM